MNAQLLRKRLAPDIENWVAKGLKAGKRLEVASSRPAPSAEPRDSTTMALDSYTTGDMTAEEWADLWEFAAPEAELIATTVFPELSGSYEEDDEDEVMEGEKPPEPMPLDDILRLMSSGAKVGGGPMRAATGFAQRS
jgi:hypothetical protein